MVLVHMGIADEIGEPARGIAGQPTEQRQQCRPFGEVEWRTQAKIIGTDIKRQRELARCHVGVELVQQMARRQGHFIELGAVPAMEQDAPAARVVCDGVQALTDLIDGFVQDDKRHAILFILGNLTEPGLLRHLDRGSIAQGDALVARPLPPLDPVDLAQVVMALAERVGQPLGVFVGVLVPDLATQLTELAGVANPAQETYHFADRRLERQLARGDGGEPLLQVEAQHRPWQADGADAGTVFLQRAVFDNVADQVQILFHGLPVARRQGDRPCRESDQAGVAVGLRL